MFRGTSFGGPNDTQIGVPVTGCLAGAGWLATAIIVYVFFLVFVLASDRPQPEFRRQISKLVGCSEGALYVHFEGRLVLLLVMLEKWFARCIAVSLGALEHAHGQPTPKKNLTTAVHGIYRFHQRAVPLLAGLFAEPDLLAAYRRSLIARNKGPHSADCSASTLY